VVNLNQILLIATSYKYPETLPYEWFLPDTISEVSGSLEFSKISSLSFLRYDSASDFAVNDGPFTIEWFQWKQPNYEYARIFSIGTFPEAKIAVSIELSSLYFWMNGEVILNESLFPFPDYTQSWKHVAITRDENSLVSLYFDGQRIATVTSTESVSNITSSLTIGNEETPTSSAQFRGYIADFHWVVGDSLYSGETITVPTSPIISTSNSKLLLNATSFGTQYLDSSPVNRISSQVSSVRWSSYGPY
jgi:hypothetical protein